MKLQKDQNDNELLFCRCIKTYEIMYSQNKTIGFKKIHEENIVFPSFQHTLG